MFIRKDSIKVLTRVTASQGYQNVLKLHLQHLIFLHKMTTVPSFLSDKSIFLTRFKKSIKSLKACGYHRALYSTCVISMENCSLR